MRGVISDEEPFVGVGVGVGVGVAVAVGGLSFMMVL